MTAAARAVKLRLVVSKKPPGRAKSGPKPKAYTKTDLTTGAIALHSGLDIALQIMRKPKQQQFPLPDDTWLPLKSAITAYLDAIDHVQKKSRDLVRVAVGIAQGAESARWGKREIDFSRKPLQLLELKIRRVLKRKSTLKPWSKPFAVFKIIACGEIDVPKRNAPEGPLLRMFEDEIAMREALEPVAADARGMVDREALE